MSVRKGGFRSRSLLAFGAVLFLFQLGCACTKPGCGGFAITSPKAGQVLPAGDVDVILDPLRADFCNLPPSAYQVTLDDGTPVNVPVGDVLKTRFSNVKPGEHTARAVALDSKGRALQSAAVKFRVEAPKVAEAPPVPTPAPTPKPTEAPLTPAVINEGGYLKDLFFDFDKYDVRDDQRANQEANGAFLGKNSMVKLTIEGHCDERGTRQYNLALGEKRANAAKEYLERLGVDGRRMTTISYGKDKPFADGHDESAWQKNRRAHYVATSN